MAANRYAEMVRWMAWPRIKNSRSSAQPGTHPHDGVQATVTPAPDAEPAPGSGQNTGVGGTTHTVRIVPAGRSDHNDTAPDRSRVGRRLRPIRYAHSAPDEPAQAAATPPSGGPAAGPSPDEPSDGNVLSGTVLSGRGWEPAASGWEPVGESAAGHDGTAGLIYEAPQPAYNEPLPPAPDELAEPVPSEGVPNEGLGIFGGVATTEVPDEDEPTRAFERQQPTAAEPGRVIPIGPAWNEPLAPPPVASEPTEDRKQNSFGLLHLIRRAGQPADEDGPRVSVRDLPPDVQLRFWRIRVTIMLVVGVLFFILTRNWAVAVTLMILAGIVDAVRRSRSAALYVNGGAHPGARKATTKQLHKMRREGYFVLDARPIPNSREIIDHLVVGPTGVYAIDSEKWNPKLPIRTWNGKKLYHGPESQKDRLEHAVWEAAQASEVLSGALGTGIVVRPALAIYGPKIPWDIATIRNVDVFSGPALRKYLKRRGRMKEDVVRLTGEEIRTIYDTAARMLPDVVQTYTPVG
jgi:hypothetical protein